MVNKKEIYMPKRTKRDWKTIEEKIQGKQVKIYAKIFNEKGDTIIYEGIYLGRIERYHLLFKCKVYRLNIFTKEKEKLYEFEQIAIKEDIIGFIEFF